MAQDFRDKNMSRNFKNTPHLYLNLILFLSLVLGESIAWCLETGGKYYVEVASYSERETARRILKKIKAETHLSGIVRQITIQGIKYYEVQVGPYQNAEQSRATQQLLQKKAFLGYIRFYPFPSPPPNLLPNSPASPGLTIIPQKPVITPIVRQTPPLNTRAFVPELVAVKSFPYWPRALGQGSLAEQTNFFDGDLLLPIMGNNDWIGYVDGSGKYGDDSAWFGSIGSGIRAIEANSLWGGYIFADHNESNHQKIFWIINPGVELMTTTWDLHFNGYIPASSRQQSFAIFRGYQLGFDTPYYERHSFYNNLYSMMDITGPGIDGEIGYTIPQVNFLRAFVGGYHFNLPDGPNISGVEGGIEVPINSRFSILLRDAYDKVQQNTVLATLRVTFGGIAKRKINPDVHDRILDPLQRHMGAYQTGAGMPIIKVTRRTDREIIQGNIWFFNPGGPQFTLDQGFNNCTYENPCGIISQSAIDGINSLATNSIFFINTGSYANPIPASGFSLYNGQSFFGRQNYFLLPAQGANRPLLDDTLFLNGNNSISNLQIQALAPTLSGITAGIQVNPLAVGAININNNNIFAEHNTLLPNRTVAAIQIVSDNVNVSISGNTLTANLLTSPGGRVFGVNNESNSPVLITSSAISTSSTNTAGMANSITAGVFNNGTASVSLLNSSIEISSVSGSAVLGTGFFGVEHIGSGTFTIDNSIINLLTQNGGGGINAAVDNSGPGLLSLNNSTLLSQGSNSLVGGLRAENNSNTTISNSNISTIALGGGLSGVFGILHSSTASMTIANSTMYAQSNDNNISVYGIDLNDGGQLNVSNSTSTSVSFGVGGFAEGLLITNGIPQVILNGLQISATGTATARGIGFFQGFLDYSNSTIAAISGGTAIAVFAGGTVTNNSNNICTENGVIVPCPS
jgi:hypothetical protein